MSDFNNNDGRARRNGGDNAGHGSFHRGGDHRGSGSGYGRGNGGFGRGGHGGYGGHGHGGNGGYGHSGHSGYGHSGSGRGGYGHSEGDDRRSGGFRRDGRPSSFHRDDHRDDRRRAFDHDGDHRPFNREHRSFHRDGEGQGRSLHRDFQQGDRRRDDQHRSFDHQDRGSQHRPFRSDDRRGGRGFSRGGNREGYFDHQRQSDPFSYGGGHRDERRSGERDHRGSGSFHRDNSFHQNGSFHGGSSFHRDHDDRGGERPFRRNDSFHRDDRRDGQRRDGGDHRFNQDDRRRDFHRDERRFDGERRDFGHRDQRSFDRSASGYRRDDRRGGQRTGGYRGGDRFSQEAPREFESQNPYTDRRPGEPKMPKGMEWSMLSSDDKRRLRGLSKEHAENIGLHILAAYALEESDPAGALAHAKWVARQASRVDIARETLGLVAYRQGEWKIADRELRTAYRMNGELDYLPIIADCERGLGHPEKAIEIALSDDAKRLTGEAKAEMMIVFAGAYADRKQYDQALKIIRTLENVPGLSGGYQMRALQAEQNFLDEAGRIAESEKLDDKADELESQFADKEEAEDPAGALQDTDLEHLTEDDSDNLRSALGVDFEQLADEEDQARWQARRDAWDAEHADEDAQAADATSEDAPQAATTTEGKDAAADAGASDDADAAAEGEDATTEGGQDDPDEDGSGDASSEESAADADSQEADGQ